MATNSNKLSVLLVAPLADAHSETFIRAHIDHLPGKVIAIYGDQIPLLTKGESGEPIIPGMTLKQHLRFSLQTRVMGTTWGDFRNEYFKKYLRSRGVDVVLAEYGPTGVMVMDICQEMGIPLVVHFHGYDAFLHDIVKTYGREYLTLFQKAAAIIAVSRDMEQKLLKLGAPREKLYYNVYGVDLSRFQGANPAKSEPIFLTTGRFVDKKGPLHTIIAFAQVLSEVPDANLMMIGDGNLLDAAMEQVKLLEITHAVEFCGIQPHQKVMDAMRQARAFVQHSRRPLTGDSEGTPVAILEASASGLPVIATRHAGIPDVILEERTGFLVDEGDVDGMAAAMLRLAKDPQLAADFGQAGRRRVEEHFSMQNSIDNLWGIIRSTIGGADNVHATS